MVYVPYRSCKLTRHVFKSPVRTGTGALVTIDTSIQYVVINTSRLSLRVVSIIKLTLLLIKLSTSIVYNTIKLTVTVLVVHDIMIVNDDVSLCRSIQFGIMNYVVDVTTANADNSQHL